MPKREIFGVMDGDGTLIDLCRKWLNNKCGATVMRLGDEKEIAKRIFDAYPFSERKNYRYQAWRKAVKEWWQHRDKLTSWEH